MLEDFLQAVSVTVKINLARQGVFAASEQVITQVFPHQFLPIAGNINVIRVESG